MGSIGRETAKRVRPLGMRVLGSRRSAQPGETDPDCDVVLGPAGFPRLLAESDFLVAAAPLTPETRHGIGAQELAAMKRSAFILNVGRGPLIDHAALRGALIDGTIAGAALDVTEPEPLPPDDPLWDAPNLFVTPHVSTAGADGASFERMAGIFVGNLRRYLAGEPLVNAVDPARGY
jgi:phosphoglycerate dehydrogenase-like enzyme